MLTQAWVDQVTGAVSGSPDVVGRGPKDDERDAWTLRYVARFVERGVPLRVALENYRAGEIHDYDADPEQAADDEMSYWDDDGEG